MLQCLSSCQVLELPLLNDNPVLQLLGRSGRGAVVEALRRNLRPMGIRELARLADVAPMVASRAVAELEAVQAVLVTRRGRALQVRLKPDTPVGAFLAALQVPDSRQESVAFKARN